MLRQEVYWSLAWCKLHHKMDMSVFVCFAQPWLVALSCIQMVRNTQHFKSGYPGCKGAGNKSVGAQTDILKQIQSLSVGLYHPPLQHTYVFTSRRVMSGHILIPCRYLQQPLVGSMLQCFGHLYSPVHHMLWQIYEGLHLYNFQPALFLQLFQLAAPGAFPSLSAFFPFSFWSQPTKQMVLLWPPKWLPFSYYHMAYPSVDCTVFSYRLANKLCCLRFLTDSGLFVAIVCVTSYKTKWARCCALPWDICMLHLHINKPFISPYIYPLSEMGWGLPTNEEKLGLLF